MSKTSKILAALLITLVAIAGVVWAYNDHMKQFDDAPKQGEMDFCIFERTEIYDDSYAEATARCEYEAENGSIDGG